MATPLRRAPAGALFLDSWHPYAWIVSAGFLLYSRALGFGYTFLDDNALILNNLANLSSWEIVPKAFRSDVFFTAGGAFYRPLMTLSLAVDAWLGGALPFFYHLSNILLHVTAAALLFRLFLRLDCGRGLSLFSALAFTVHPALSQAVAWIPGRNDTLFAVFLFAAFLQYISFLSGGAGKGRAYALHLFFFALALLTKEAAAVMPAALLLYALLLRPARPPRAYLPELAGWLAVGALWHALRAAVLNVPGLPFSAMARSLLDNLPVLLQYAGKALFPVDLSVMPTLRDTSMLYGYAAAAAIAIALILPRPRRWRRVVFGACWFALFLLPSLVMSGPAWEDFAMEHRAYIPLIGLLLVFMETGLAERLAAARWAPAAAALPLSLLACAAWRHEANFGDRLRFWGNAAATSPGSPLTHRNLGVMYHLSRLYGPAEKEYRTAIALNPAEPMAHTSLGVLEMNLGRFKEAESEMRKEIEVNPYYDNGYYNLARLYRVLGREKERTALLKRTLEVNPAHPGARADLAAGPSPAQPR